MTILHSANGCNCVWEEGKKLYDVGDALWEKGQALMDEGEAMIAAGNCAERARGRDICTDGVRQCKEALALWGQAQALYRHFERRTV